MGKLIYLPIKKYLGLDHEGKKVYENNFDIYKTRLKFDKQTFETQRTTYTYKIKHKGRTILFNENGLSDQKVLTLISKVRAEAREFIKRGNVLGTENINFFNLYGIPYPNEVVLKVDIKAAYWNLAIKKAILSDETNRYFHKLYEGKSYKEAKSARLKALGSLATKKEIVKYWEGVRQEQTIDDFQVEPTRDLYLDICRGVDLLMQDCAREVENVYYYYWDCIFAPKTNSKKVVEFLKDSGYDVKIGETKLTYIDIGEGGGWLKSISDGKEYMVRKEDKHLIFDL